MCGWKMFGSQERPCVSPTVHCDDDQRHSSLSRLQPVAVLVVTLATDVISIGSRGLDLQFLDVNLTAENRPVYGRGKIMGESGWRGTHKRSP